MENRYTGLEKIMYANNALTIKYNQSELLSRV